jgi:hypothetical protein
MNFQVELINKADMRRLRGAKSPAARTAVSSEIVDPLGWDRACCPDNRIRRPLIGSG